MSQKAVLIISDGEHSKLGDIEGEEARIPDQVAKKIKAFSASHKDVPVVIITVDRMIESEKAKKGSDYETKWTKELTKHCVGKSFYYKPGSKPEDSLPKIFNIIVPHRDKVLLSRNPYSDRNKEFFFSEENDEYVVGLKIRCTLPKAELVVEGYPNWKADSYLELAKLFSVKWVEREGDNPNRNKQEKKSDILPLTDSPVKYEDLKITCLNLEKAFPVSREPREFTLIFSLSSGSGTNQDKPEIDKISLVFKQKLPAVEITKRFSEMFVMRSNVKNHLKFQSEIDLPDHLQQDIPLIISVPENDCFYEYQTERLLLKDTTGSPGRGKFNLSIRAKRVPNICYRISDDNILINFKTANNGKVQPIDANQVGAIDFRVVSRWLYWPYQINQFMYIPFLIVLLLFVTFPFLVEIYDNENKTLWRVQQKWYFIWFEATGNPKSNIEKAVLSWEGSGKRKRSSEKTLDLSKKDFIWPIRNYQITLQEKGGTAQEDNLRFSHNAEKWGKQLKTLFLGVCYVAALFAGVSLYVSWPWNIPMPMLIFIVIVLTALITWQFARHGDSILPRLRAFGIITSLSEEFVGVLRFICSNIFFQ